MPTSLQIICSSSDIYLFKVNDTDTRTTVEIYSKLTIKIPVERYRRRSGVFIVNFEHISQILLVYPFDGFEHVLLPYWVDTGDERNNTLPIHFHMWILATYQAFFKIRISKSAAFFQRGHIKNGTMAILKIIIPHKWHCTKNEFFH